MFPISAITFSTPSSTSSVFVEEVTLQAVYEPFTRSEFDVSKLRQAPTDNGSIPIIGQGIGGKPIQLGSACTGDTARPLGPNSLANTQNILQRFNIQRFTIKGAASYASEVFKLKAIADAHLRLLQQFDYHVQVANSLEVSYNSLIALQSETFSYLTTTGLTMSGIPVGGTYSNCLISQFEEGVLYTSEAMGVPSNEMIKEFSITVDLRTITSQAAG